MRKTSSILMSFLLTLSILSPIVSAEGDIVTTPPVEAEVTTSSTDVTTPVVEEPIVEPLTETVSEVVPETVTEPVSPPTTEPTEDTTVKATTDKESEEATAEVSAEDPTEEVVEEEVVEEEVVEEVEEEVVEEEEVLEEEVPAEDYTGIVEKRGIHVVIHYKEDTGASGFIPEFTLVHGDAKGKVLSTVKAGPQNYNKETQSYNLVFNNPGYKLGEKYQILLSKKDSIIKNLEMNVTYFEGEDVITETTTLELNNYFVFTIRGSDFLGGKDGETPMKILDPSQDLPLEGILTTDNTKTGFIMQDEAGNPLKGATLQVEVVGNNKPITLKSDNRGIAWINSSSLSNKFIVSSQGRLVVGTQTGFLQLVKSIPTNIQQNAITHVIKFKNAPKETKGVDSIVNLKVSTPANTELSSYWAVADLVLTNAKGKKLNFTVDLEDKEIAGLADGTYKVSATGKYANVSTANTLTVKNGKGSLNVVLKPKYVLQVDKDGESFAFTVLNKSDKQYKGTKPNTFGVTPGESYMIKDDIGGDVYTVAIDADSTVTRLVLGTGVVFGGSATIPHTGDGIMFLVALFIASLMGAGISYLIHTKKIKIRKLTTQAMSILLIGALLGSLLPANTPTVHAEDGVVIPIGSGTPGKNGKLKNTPTGAVQTDPNVSVVMMGLTKGSSTDGEATLGFESIKSDLEHSFKFAEERQRNMFYMASNKTNYDVFRKSTSSLITYEGGGKLRQIHGNPKKALFPNTYASKMGVKGTMSSRLLPLPETALNDPNQWNGFIIFMAYATKYLNEDTSTNRQIWSGKGSVSVRNMGDSLGKEYFEWLQKNLNTEDEALLIDGFLNTTAILEGYLTLLEQQGQTDVTETLLDGLGNYLGTDEFGDYVLLTQVVQSFYVKGASPRVHAFMPMHDAVEWYTYGRAKETSKFRAAGVTPNHEAKIIYSITPTDGPPSSSWNKVTPSFTYKGNTKETNGHAIKPRTNNVRIVKPTNSASSLNTNPFAGWGFMPVGFPGGQVASQPRLSASYNVKVLNSAGNPTGETFTTPIAGYTGEGKLLSDVTTNEYISEGLQFKSNGRFFSIKPNSTSNLKLYDKKDPKDNLLNLDAGVTGKVAIPSYNDPNRWMVAYGFQIPTKDDLLTYLGGTSGFSMVVPKYLNGQFSNAHLVIDIEVTEMSTGGGGVVSSHNVPQWAMSKYFPDLSKGKYDKAIFDITLPASEGDNQKLSPSGNLKFDLVGPNLKGATWADSKPKLFNGHTEKKPISINSTIASWDLGGDLLAVKDSSISKLKLASWVNNGSILNDRITASSKGIVGAKTSVAKKHNFVYGVKSPYDPFVFSETRYNYTPAVYDFFGLLVSGGYSTPYGHSANATSNYNNAEYDTTVTFGNFVPNATTSTKKFTDTKKPANGMYWETKQSSDVLRVNPEVLMGYQDNTGATSVAFVAGEQLRPVQPVNYNVAQYVRVDVKPTATGMSVATDTQAKKLATSLGKPNLGVTYKGSALTTNFEVAGDLELKTFAVDIGSTALKNAWNPATTYSTDKVNDEFLSRHATKGADGRWTIALNADSKLKINNLEYGGKKSTINATQSSETVVEHTLVVRGGQLVSVNGSTNLASLPQGLKDALARMNISTATNVFSNFAKNQGALLIDPAVVALGNAVRGGGLASNLGWYNEDTTQLVVREYTNTFKLPQIMAVDKIPLEIPGIETPIDKMQFFNKGYLGYTTLNYKLVEAYMNYDSSQATPFGGVKTESYIVPNASVMDTFN